MSHRIWKTEERLLCRRLVVDIAQQVADAGCGMLKKHPRISISNYCPADERFHCRICDPTP